MIMKMEAEDKMILDNIDEFLNDEGRIVTYKFLSLTLSIHVNKAKLLLEEYLKSKNDDEYEVVYFLGGAKTVANKQALKFTLAKKENLEAIKRKFDAVNICHIYSAQKSNLKDIELLYSTDYDIIKKSLHDIHHYSEVQCKFTRRTNLQPPKVNNNISTNGNHTEKRQPLPASKQPAKEKKKSPDKGKETSTAAFFGTKTTGKKSNASNEIQKDTKKPEPKKEKPNNKLADAFSKSKVKPKQEEKKEDSKKLETEEEEEKEKAEVAESCDKKNDKQTSKTSKPQCKDKYRDLPKAEKPKNRKAVMQGSDDEDDFENFLANTKKDKSDSASTKSNKRTAVFEEEEKEDDDDVIAPTPEPLKKPKNKRRKKEPEKSLTPPKLNTDTEAKEETKKAKKEEEPLQAKEEIKNVEKVEALQVDSPPSNTTTEERSEIISTQKRRGKRTVLKSKQYMSEDGFMITQKEYEEESFSENSDVEEMSCQTEISQEIKRAVEAQKTVKALENRAKVHTQKIKTQSSLTSFFKRK